MYPNDSYLMAPLTDYTDLPFRKSIRQFGAKYVFTQMIDAGALVWVKRSNKELADKNRKIVTRGPNEDWLGVQLLGNKPDIIEEAVEILNDYEFDVLDLNMGCPMKKVVKRGCGAAMYDDQDLAIWCLEKMLEKSRIPVTAKIRIVDYSDPEPNIAWAKRLEATGIKALTVHGRLREAIYSGEPSFDILREIDQALDIKVIANGGIMAAKDALEMRQKTAIDSGMVARGAIGNPWIFRELQPDFMAKVAKLETVPKFAPSPQQLVDVMRQNFADMVDFHGAEAACRVSRKTILAYLKGRGYKSTFRDQASRLPDVKAYENFFNQLEMTAPADAYIDSVTFYDDFI